MTLPTLCIERPVMTTLLTMAIVLVGGVGYLFLPVAALPQVDFPTISVSTTLPGASPSTMAASIATPLEREFSAIAGIDSITSVSGLGIGRITVQFNLNRNIDAAAQDIQAAIGNAARKLPAEMTTPPSYRKVNPGASAVLQLTLVSKTSRCRRSTNLPRSILVSGFPRWPAWRRSPSSARKNLPFGSRLIPTCSLPVAFRSTRSSARLPQQARPRRLGRSAVRKRRRPCRRIPQLTRASDYRAADHRLSQRRSGAPRRRCRGHRQRTGPPIWNWYNGDRALSRWRCSRQPDANTVEVVNQVKALIPAFAPNFRALSTSMCLQDRAAPIRAAVTDVQHTLILTVVLVVLVIFLFVRRLVGDHHSGACPAGIDHRHLCRHVSRRILPQQCFAARAHARGRVRGRRRDRDARKHRPPHAKPAWTNGGGSQRFARDHLHDRIDDHLAGRGIHPGFFHGGRGRARIPRICQCDRHRHFGVGLCVVDADADAVQPFPASAPAASR